MKKEMAHQLISDFLAKHAENVAKVQQEYNQNSIPYLTTSAEGHSISRVLKEQVFKWRPWDRRRYLQFMDSSFTMDSTEFNKALHDSFDVSVVGFQDNGPEGIVQAHILLDAHAGDRQKYNELVDEVRNQETKEDMFDASTGTYSSPKNASTVYGGTPRRIRSEAKHVFQAPVNVLQDDLLSGVQVPKADWKVAASWMLTLEVIGTSFKISSLVTTMNGRVLSYITMNGDDLSELGIQLMHRVFGNTVDQGMEADFYDGIRQLLAGEKADGASPSKCTRKAVETRQGYFDRLGNNIVWAGALWLIFLIFFRGFNGSWFPWVIGISLCLLGAILPIFTAPLLVAKAEKDQATSIKL